MIIRFIYFDRNMFDSFSSPAMFLLAQEGGLVESLFSSPLPLIIALGVLFYLIVLGPDRRKRAELQAQLQRLKKNDEVVTAGGIFGKVVNVSQGSDKVTLRIDDNSGAKMTVLRSSIQRVITAEEPPKKDEKKSA